MACKIFSAFLTFLLFLLHLHFSAGLQQTDVQAGYWFPASGLLASGINSTLFTHLLCAFADVNSTTYQVTIPSSNQAPFSSFTQTVQKKNPSVKTLLSIGGGGANPETFASMASQNSSRGSFISSSISLARSYGFSGLDLDWEYPSNSTQMTNLGTLLNEWRAAVDSEAESTNNKALLLSAAVFYSWNYYSVLYPTQNISNNLDWINIMAYDFYGPGWSSVTGPPAALYNPGNQVSGDSGITAWIQSGLSAKQIVLGLPFYGYAWNLTNANNHGLFAPTNGAAISSDGSIGYSEILSYIKQNNATKVFNATVVSDYCYSGTTWIGYDDTQSISTKVSYAKGKGLLGYFAWQVGDDSNWTLSSTG
ncbi:Glyco_hydro_18 domain-containing protein [Cephalotus follicularis]|uniref:Glyco_hydro_18 domain-containing protein n=1 Tax=Cephalotus follicularis TaxID=3775 RepID=A0A1Q3DG14_CEPFO|nr:Glyco_hydro_18 domain-containing protein [Cephalotus follicularis]GAV91391.1 Glyco_hydro_18 domain-containing protein [Cephalotus follicularis]